MDPVLTPQEAADRLGVSRRRVQALIERGQLEATRIGGRWVIEPSRLHQRQRVTPGRGRPLQPRTVWRLLTEGHLPGDRAAWDAFRRSCRPRAVHRSAYVHPSCLPILRADPRVVLSGRSAADAALLPVDDDGSLHVYVRSDQADAVLEDQLPKYDAPVHNLHVHVVPHDAWPFEAGQRLAPLVVAWMDLADEGDRAERLVREHLLRTR